ncbi:unnamed protein product [Rotaria sp. Silwood1]|nr:unnamed protein product [Rotaria sp. Silwood1]
MFNSRIELSDLPDEILMIILKELHNSEVLYSVMGINKRFDRIVNDSIFTRNLTLITPFNDLNQLTGPILDRFCLQIIPQIHHKIEWIHIESSWIEPILQVTNYPNLHGLGLYNLTSKRATDLFTEGGPTDSFEDTNVHIYTNL